MAVPSQEKRVPSRPWKPLVERSEIQWDIENQTLVIGKKTLTFSRAQYRFLLLLRDGTPVTYTEIAWKVFHCGFDKQLREVMNKHVERIRGKLQGSGVYLYCVMGYGYVLLEEI